MTPLLSIKHLSVAFHVKVPGRFGLPAKRALHAVRDVSLDVRRGETYALVGESGSGKSTLANAVAGLVPLSSGSVQFEGADVVGYSRKELREFRRRIGMVFQDPYSSFTPSMRVGDAIAEPLLVHTSQGPKQREQRAVDLLDQVGLSADAKDRYPHEFSGGQRQRIAIARAIALNPSLLLLDEPVSALDVSTQSQVINLLLDIQEEFGLAYVLISHDLAVVQEIATMLGVMYFGEIVEQGRSREVLNNPRHPYTEALINAARLGRDKGEDEHIVVRGELPSPLDPPQGCAFHTRCPYVMDRCREEAPLPREVAGEVAAACHLHWYGPKLDGTPVTELKPNSVTELGAERGK